MLASCNKENVNTNNSTVLLPVVQAYLLPGDTSTVKLYYQKGLTDTAQYGEPLTGMQVYISNGSKNVLLTESAKGTYTYIAPGFLVAGNTYTLQFKYLSYTVSAKTIMPSKPSNFATSHSTIDISSTSTGLSSTILDRLSWDNPDSLNHVLVFFEC